ncbi:uncharacterized protein LOC119835729 [Zerene cesonia]|uniref:uncharacterized protein LOC119835729 n=1 Tax=Zerene cesonia TaxID=33412 RepID=UPI0018E50F01|nr:uncharacterized protein LOC119835729 [Zerene cesonia]
MAWLSYKFVVLVIAASVYCAPEGYNYNKPNVPLQLPIQTQDSQQAAPQQAGQIFQKTVSYSISHEDYEYLKHQKDEQAQNGALINNPIPHQPLINQLDTAVANTILEADANKETIVQNSDSSLYNIQNNIQLFNSQISPPVYHENVPPVLQLQPPAITPNNYYAQAQINNVALNSQNGIQQIVNIQNGASNELDVHGNSSPVNVQIASGQNFQNNVQPLIPVQGFQPFTNVNGPQYNPPSNEVSAPVITKHIYFHVPPPDVEEVQRIPSPPPPKKTYKILFIKLPAQASASNANQLQSSLRAAAPIEEKTLIYVLVKKPEEQQVIVTNPPKLSEHEVLFVNYRDNPITETEEIERVVEIPQRNSRVNSQTLQPGSDLKQIKPTSGALRAYP